MGAASLSSCSLTKTTVCSICSTRKSIITNASSTPTPRIMKRPFKWSKPVRQKRIKSSNKETLGKWETEKWCCLPFDLPRSPYIFAGRQECRALMTRSPIYRIPTGSRLREINLNADQSQDCWAEGKHDHCNYLSAGWQVETEELSSMWFFLLVKPALHLQMLPQACFDTFRPKVRVHHTYTEENRFGGEGYVGQHEQDGRRDPHCVSWDVVSNVPHLVSTLASGWS